MILCATLILLTSAITLSICSVHYNFVVAVEYLKMLSNERESRRIRCCSNLDDVDVTVRAIQRDMSDALSESGVCQLKPSVRGVRS
jgi:hypothetical protein